MARRLAAMSEPTPAARITRADVEHVARLARLALTDAEAEIGRAHV